MAKTSRPAPKNKPPAAPVPLTSGTTKPSPPAPAQRPPQPPTASPKRIEEQVDALLDTAQKQVQTMAELTNEEESSGDSTESAPAAPAPPEAAEPESAPLASASAAGEPSVVDGAAPPVADASGESTEPPSGEAPEANAEGGDESAPSQPTAKADDPVDPAVLQRQVDAILAEAGYPVGEPAPEAEIAPAREAPQVSTSPASVAAEEHEPEQDEPPAAVDLSEVDAVIADAAQRAMEEDDFDSVAAEPSEATGAAASPAAGAKSPPAVASAPARPKAVKKGGDASMRRENRKRKPSDVDLDGEFTSTAPLTSAQDDRDDESAEESNEELTFEPVAAVESPSESWLEMVHRQAMATLALANAPWHTWSVFTRYAVLAVTIGNGLLALIAFVVVLRRLW